MHIDTVRFSHILETSVLADLDSFLSRTAFIVSHKSESVETLLGVLWYLPASSPTIVVTNCPQDDIEQMKRGLAEQLPHHQKVYLIHQKEEGIADLFNRCGVDSILGRDGKVVDGKGEGMYIGTLCAFLLGYPEWVIFYDADNFVPSALLEYTLAMSRLFMSSPAKIARYESDALVMDRGLGEWSAPDLHNVRICWASKPALGSGNLQKKLLGRCTRVVSPIFSTLLEECYGIEQYAIVSSNAGEQAMTMKTARTLRFSSGFSVETFQMLDLLFHAQSRSAILQQYQAKSPHFHEKKDDAHIKKMIAESLGSFFCFEGWLPHKVKRQLRQVYDELGLEFVSPVVYPALQELYVVNDETFMSQYKLSQQEKALAIVWQAATMLASIPFKKEPIMTQRLLILSPSVLGVGIRSILEQQGDWLVQVEPTPDPEVIAERGLSFQPHVTILDPTCIDILVLFEQLGLPSVKLLGKIIVATMEGFDEELLFFLMKWGVSACLGPTTTAEDLVALVKRVCAGEYLLSSDLLRPAPSKASRLPTREMSQVQAPALCETRKQAFAPVSSPLTGQEAAILAQMALGKSNNDIASVLRVNEKSLKSRITIIFRKLGVDNRTSAVVRALSRRWIDMPGGLVPAHTPLTAVA